MANVLVDVGDIHKTINNINVHNLSLRLSIIVALLTQLVSVFLVLYLYMLLQPENKNHAVLMVIFSLLAVPITMFNELN